MVHSEVPAEQEEELTQGWIDYYWEPLKNYFEKRKRNVWSNNNCEEIYGKSETVEAEQFLKLFLFSWFGLFGGIAKG